MAGSPKKRADMVKLEGFEELIFDRLDEGVTQAKIAAELGVMPSSLGRWLNATDARKAKLKEARGIAGDVLAEATLGIADGTEHAVDNAEVQSAKLRIETRMKLAAVWNPDRYGDKQAGVTINIGSLHLDALRQAQAATPAVDMGSVVEAIAEPLPAVVVPLPSTLDVPADDAFGLM